MDNYRSSDNGSGASSYVIPEGESEDAARNVIHWSDQTQHLPRFLRWSLSASPGNSMCARVGFCLTSYFSSIVGAGLPMAYILKSVPLGLTFGIVMAVCNTFQVALAPNMHHEYFWKLILDDVVDLNKKMKKQFVGGLTFNMVVFSPLLFYFLYLPLTNSDLVGGANYKTMWLILWVCMYALAPYQFLAQGLTYQVTLKATGMWSDKCRNYFINLRESLVAANEDTRKSVNATIATYQREVEDWSSTTNHLLHGFNTVGIIVPLLLSVTSLVMITNMPADSSGADRAIAIALTALFSLFMTWFFCMSIYAVAKPSMSFERNKWDLLNDMRVVDANIKRGWTQDEFNQWLSQHELSAAVAFGVKITGTKMRSIGGVVASGLGIVLYVLLREELRGMLG